MRVSIISLLSAFLMLLLSCTSIPQGKHIRKSTSVSWKDFFDGRDTPEWESSGNGIYLFRFRDAGSNLAVDAVKIDLRYPGRKIVVSRGIKPSEDGGHKTMNFRSRTITGFMNERNTLLAINATPFYPYRFFPGQKQTAVGVVISGGVIYSRESRYAALFFRGDNMAEIVEPPFDSLNRWEYGAGGFFMVLRDGRIIAEESSRDVRSVAGRDVTGRYLFLSVIGGGAGVTFREAAEWIRYIGAEDALLLDGGGSSVIAVRDNRKGKVRILNNPKGGVVLYFKRLSPVFLGVR